MLLQIIRSSFNIRIKVKNNRKEEKEKKARRNLGTGKKHDDKKQQKTASHAPFIYVLTSQQKRYGKILKRKNTKSDRKTDSTKSCRALTHGLSLVLQVIVNDYYYR